MKVLLVAPIESDPDFQNFPAPSLGLVRIVSYCRSKMLSDAQKGVNTVEFEIYDAQIHSDHSKSEADIILDRYKGEDIDILGISCLHYTLVPTLELLNKWKKEHPESLLVVGNMEASANYQEIFDLSPADICVLGEGEEPFLGIIQWKLGNRNFENIPGIVRRSYAKPISEEKLLDICQSIDFTQGKYEDFWEELYKRYPEGHTDRVWQTAVRLVTTTYCNLGCKFCSLTTVHGQITGQKTIPVDLKAEDLMALIQRVRDQVPRCKKLYFVSDDILFFKDEFMRFVDLYKVSEFNGWFQLMGQTHSRNLDEDTLKRLGEIGFIHMTVGVESGSKRLRDLMGKSQPQNKLDMIPVWGKASKVSIYYLVILIPPEATIPDLWDCVLKIDEWKKSGAKISIEPVTYTYRGTPYYNTTLHQYQSVMREIPGTSKFLKDPTWILPEDPIVRELAIELKEKQDAFVKARLDAQGIQHKAKGNTAPYILELAKILLLKHSPDEAKRRGIDPDNPEGFLVTEALPMIKEFHVVKS